MQDFSSQFKYVVRRLLRTPLFTVLTLITLALGIGANTAIFSVINGVLLKPLPYPNSDRLVAIWETAPGIGAKEMNASPGTYFIFREQGRAFQDLGIWNTGSVNITGMGEPERLRSLNVTDGVLPVLGVSPGTGRWFSKKDDLPGSPGTVILSYGYWQRRFGGDHAVLGRRLVLDGEAHEVIGVMPQSFRFMNRPVEVILPIQLDRAKVFLGNFSWQAVARLKPGFNVGAANADVARMLPIMLRSFPPPPGISVGMFQDARLGPNVRPLKNDVVGDVGKVLWILMGTVGIVLFIACANVANLLLVRAEGRQQELAVRAALGADWRQIARELLSESVTLGIAGGALGLGLAAAALRLLVRLAPANLPRLDEISLDPPVLLFTLVIALAAGVLFGLIPVFKYAGPQLASTLREGGRALSEGRERHRARNILVVVQVALALVLLISSGLMIRTLYALKQVQPGFTDPDNILTLRVSIPESHVADNERPPRMFNEIVRKISELPGVSAAGLTNSITMDGNNDNDPVFDEDHPPASGKLPALRRFKFISPGLFKTMGTPLLAGRDLTWTDIYQKRPVLLVSENLARELWGSPGGALGKRVRENLSNPWREVIGVVGNERDNGVDEKAPTVVYWPMVISQFWNDKVSVRRNLAVAIRSSRTGSDGFLKEIRQAVWSVDPDLPIANVRTVGEIYGSSMARTSFTLVLLSIAAGMALLLGVVGIYGVLSYSISQRTREIGIRMALGASEGTVRQMFMGHGMRLTAIGVACGMAVALALTRVMSSLLFGVSPMDPLTYCAVPVVLGLSALLASYLPSRRATLIQPVEALRAE